MWGSKDSLKACNTALRKRRKDTSAIVIDYEYSTINFLICYQPGDVMKES